MGKKFLIFLVSIALIFIITASGCSAGVDEEIISIADSAAENVLIAIDDQNFDSYNKDMDDGMLKTVTEQYFTTLSTYIKEAIGEYEQGSKEYLSSNIQDELYVVIFEADYTKETEKVAVVVVVSVTDEGICQIAGLWFDSPKLREIEGINDSEQN